MKQRRIPLGLAFVTALAVCFLSGPAAHAGGVRAADPPPTVTSISPSSGIEDGGTTVTITGTNLAATTGVSFGSAPAQSFQIVSDTTVSAVSPFGEPGAVDVTVEVPGGTSASSAADEYTYTSTLPAITGISPGTGFTTGGTRVTLTGTNFRPGNESVQFGVYQPGQSADIVSQTADQIVVLTPPAAVGIDHVFVTTNSGQSLESGAADFEYVGVVPLVAVQGRGGALDVSPDGKGFANYGGVLLGAPSVVSGNDRNYYFVRGTNHALFVRTDKTGFRPLQRGTPGYCATPPAAMLEPADTFIVACLGRTGTMFTATGTLPVTGNPTIGAFAESTAGGFNTDLSAVPGGIATDGDGDFVVTGTPYAAVPSHAGDDATPAGNTYVLPVQGGHAVSGSDELAAGGTCGGTASIAIPGPVPGATPGARSGYYVACRGLASSAITSYEVVDTYDTSTEAYVITTYAVPVGGASLGSPVALPDVSGDGIDILTTGTGGGLFEAAVADDHRASPFLGVPLYARSASGPAISAGPQPYETSRTRPHFARL